MYIHTLAFTLALVPTQDASQLRMHTPKLFNQLATEPSILKYVPAHPITTEADFVRDFYDDTFRDDSGCVFAVYDKLTAPHVSNTADDSNYAGIMMLAHASTTNQATEMGILIFPALHRAHVTSNAIGLLLVSRPAIEGWFGTATCYMEYESKNEGSRRAAERMGFELERIAR